MGRADHICHERTGIHSTFTSALMIDNGDKRKQHYDKTKLNLTKFGNHRKMEELGELLLIMLHTHLIQPSCLIEITKVKIKYQLDVWTGHSY